MSSAAPGWYPVEGDPRLRWWDGQAWTEHFHEGQGPSPTAATAQPSIAVSSSTGSGFPEDAIWSAIGKSLTGGGAGRYWLTAEHLVIDANGQRTAAQQVPLTHVADVEVTQTMTQKARGVSTVKVHVNQAGGVGVLSLDDLPEGRIARALISQAATRARMATPVPVDTPSADGGLPSPAETGAPTVMPAQASAPAQSPTPAQATATQVPEAVQPWSHAPSADPMELLRMLAELHNAGLLTAEEFDAKRTQVLSRL
jgi:hypothetical protein